MNNRTVIAADIAKNVFQCVQFKNNHQIGKNKVAISTRSQKGGLRKSVFMNYIEKAILFILLLPFCDLYF